MFYEITGNLYGLESAASCGSACSTACFTGCSNGCDLLFNPRASVRVDTRFDVFAIVIGP